MSCSIGLVVLPAFISHEQQKQLIRWSLADQARHPNATNLDAHYDLPEEGLWNSWLGTRADPSSDLVVQPRVSDPAIPEEPPGPRRLINNTPVNLQNLLDLSAAPKHPPSPSPTAQPSTVSTLLRKLRWANIGCQSNLLPSILFFINFLSGNYHWGTKQYDFSKGKGTVDDQLRDVCKSAVGSVDWREVFGDSDPAEWEDGGPDWDTWDETYGRYPVCLASPLFIQFSSRT